MSIKHKRTIRIEIEYSAEQEALDFIRSFKREFFQVHEFKKALGGLNIDIQDTTFKEPAFDYPKPRIETIDGKLCHIYKSRIDEI